MRNKTFYGRESRPVFHLSLADGSSWSFSGKSEGSARLVSRFAMAMGMDELDAYSQASARPATRKVSIKVLKKVARWRELPLERGGEIACRVGPIDPPGELVLQLLRVALVVVDGCERNGGLLVHGALAAWKGSGVVLCGPSGVGKSTASWRLPPPWRSLSDDTTLIVKAPDGQYWAHPWPTWSRYRQGSGGASWAVGTPVKLDLICMLVQEKNDWLAPLPPLYAIQELVEVSRQSLIVVANGLSAKAFSRINLARFHNAIAISKNIPIRRLQISRKGEFWKEIETFLGDPERTSRENEN